MRLALEITGAEERHLAELAARLSVSPSELASAILRDLLARPDEALEQAARRVREENRDLHEGLA